MSSFSHVNESGRARMVDVSNKPVTARSATAKALVSCAEETLRMVLEGSAPKGAVIATAEIAGVLGAKRTAELIPLCHPLPLTKIDVRIDIDPSLPGFVVNSETRTRAETGVEMEALTAVSIAALTLFDMLKAVDKGIVIHSIELLSKTGGKSDISSR